MPRGIATLLLLVAQGIANGTRDFHLKQYRTEKKSSSQFAAPNELPGYQEILSISSRVAHPYATTFS